MLTCVKISQTQLIKFQNVDNDLNAKGAQITATDTKIAAKQGEIDSYKVKVISTDLNPDERNHTAHDNLNDYEYNHGSSVTTKWNRLTSKVLTSKKLTQLKIWLIRRSFSSL